MHAATSISMVRANLAVGILSVVAALLVLVPFGLLWGEEELFRGIETAFRIPVLVAGALVGVVVHEALHAVGYLSGGAPRHTIHFGINWKVLSPFAGCRHPMTASGYRVAIVLPALVLGVVPSVAAMGLGWGWMVWWGYLMLVMAAGDAAALWAMRRVPGAVLVQDHPTRVGCEVVDGDVARAEA